MKRSGFALRIHREMGRWRVLRSSAGLCPPGGRLTAGSIPAQGLMNHRDKHKLSPMTFRPTSDDRDLVVRLAATLTLKRGRRFSMSDVVVEALRLLARK